MSTPRRSPKAAKRKATPAVDAIQVAFRQAEQSEATAAASAAAVERAREVLDAAKKTAGKAGASNAIKARDAVVVARGALRDARAKAAKDLVAAEGPVLTAKRAQVAALRAGLDRDAVVAEVGAIEAKRAVEIARHETAIAAFDASSTAAIEAYGVRFDALRALCSEIGEPVGREPIYADAAAVARRMLAAGDPDGSKARAEDRASAAWRAKEGRATSGRAKKSADKMLLDRLRQVYDWGERRGSGDGPAAVRRALLVPGLPGLTAAGEARAAELIAVIEAERAEAAKKPRAELATEAARSTSIALASGFGVSLPFRSPPGRGERRSVNR
jgi:hypothetical protein